MRDVELRGRSPVPRVVMAVALLGVLWFVRARITRTPPTAPSPPRLDGAVYLRDVAPAMRTAGCATEACHGGPARPHLAPSLADAADAVREFHDMATAAPTLVATVTGTRHARALTDGRCELAALRAWTLGQTVPRCQSGGPQRRVVR